MNDSAFYVREQLAHRETPVLPRSLPIEEPLAVLLDQRKGGKGWRGKLPHYMACPVSFGNWETMIKQPDGTFIDAYQVQWEWTDDIARVIKPPLSVIPAEKYTFPDFSLFWNDEKARNVEKAVEANRGKYLYGGPDAMFWEILWHLYGTEDALIAMIDEPEKVQGLFEKNYELLIKFVDKCCEYPVEAILLSDDIADQRGPLFGLERWRELEKPFIKKLYDYIHSKGKKVMTHICGSVRPFIPDLIDIGQDLIESVQPEAAGMNPYELKSEFGNDLCFWGCLGCQSAATFFTPGKLRDEIKRLKENMYRGGGFILSPTKPLNIMVPLENMDVILEEFCEG